MVKQDIKLFDNYGILTVNHTEFLFDKEDLSVIQSRHWYADKDGYLVHSYFYFWTKAFYSISSADTWCKTGTNG